MNQKVKKSSEHDREFSGYRQIGVNNNNNIIIIIITIIAFKGAIRDCFYNLLTAP